MELCFWLFCAGLAVGIGATLAMTNEPRRSTWFEDVGEFCKKFGVPRGFLHCIPPGLEQFRIKFMHEELAEYERAVEAGLDEEAFDALLDLCYVAVGTGWLRRFPMDEGWRRVHAANMAKERSRSKNFGPGRGSAWDVVKPAGWRPPVLRDLL